MLRFMSTHHHINLPDLGGRGHSETGKAVVWRNISFIQKEDSNSNYTPFKI